MEQPISGVREIIAAVAAVFTHGVIAKNFEDGDLSSWQSFLGAIIAAAVVWCLCDWLLRIWAQKREARRTDLTGSWGSLVKREDNKKLVGISVLNIHSAKGRISVEGRTFDFQYDSNEKLVLDASGKPSLESGGDWHSIEAAFSDKSLLYRYVSHNEQVSGMSCYTFSWPNKHSSPKGYSGTFYDHGGWARNVEGARAGNPIDIGNPNLVRDIAQQVRDFHFP
jgi:hypothetical protein